MALSDYDKKYLDKRQQQAVLTYTAQYERAIREGNRQAAQMAHEGAEAIRRLAGYSGGGEGDSFLKPAAAVSKTISVSTNGKTSYQTVPAASAATVERADKLPTPSATRQDRSSRGGGFGSTRAGGFGGTGGSTSLATRIGQGAVSGLAEAGALLSATAGTVMDVRGGTGMTPVYREQTQALTRQIDALEKELRDPALTARERQDANDALRIAREQRNVYTQATAANQGTAQKLYETTDEGLRYAREQAEKSVRGTSGLEREVLSRVPGMTQNAAITGLNLVAPWLGTTTAVLGDAGAAETRYRHDSGADYDAKAAAALGARVIGGDTARILAGELVRDYAETLRELYAERRRQAAPPQLAEPDRPQLSQSAYADALSRLEDSNGADLTKPVSAYSAPPSVIELPETLHPTAPAPTPQSALADIYKEAYNTVKEAARRYPKPKLWGTFPPYDKSFSEANELATRWAHREDIEAGYQKAVSYHGKWYLIEKFDSADLGYQIVERLSDEEYNKFARRYEDDKSNGSRQSLHEKIDWIGE